MHVLLELTMSDELWTLVVGLTYGRGMLKVMLVSSSHGLLDIFGQVNDGVASALGDDCEIWLQHLLTRAG